MTQENNVKDLIAQFNEEGRSKTLAEFIATLFKDQLIEIYLGDTYEEVSVEQISVSYPAVFCGKVVAAYKECLIVSAAYVDNREDKFNRTKFNKSVKFGNLMFINERSIRALNAIDGKGTIEDMFLRSKEALILKKIMK